MREPLPTPRRRITHVAAFIVSLLAAPMSAQTVSDYRPHVDSLEREWRRQESAQAARDSVERATRPADTVRVGALTILTQRDLMALVRESAEIASADIARTFGENPAALLRA